MEKRTKIIIFVLALLCVFFFPLVPISIQVPFSEQVPVLTQVTHREVFVDSESITVDGDDYAYWSKEFQSNRSAVFVVNSSAAVEVAVLSLVEFTGFESTLQLPETGARVHGTSYVNFTYLVESPGSYYFVVYNNVEASGTESTTVDVHEVSISEIWVEEEIEYTIKRGIRTETRLATIWELISGTTRVY